MRPERLELEGFTCFRERAEVDFGGVDLFALSGPTGAGKSSVIDAMTFALYGSVPRLDRRQVAGVVAQNAPEARVRFDFTVGGTGYTAARVVRRTRTGATTPEARLVREDGHVLAGDADGVTAAAVELLGLTFEHFTTCVSLPQGDFARFLHGRPGDRQDLLVRLLDLGVYTQMAQRARERAAAARAGADAAGQQLARLAGADPAAVEQASARVRRLDELLAAVEQRAPALDRLAAEGDAARDRARRQRAAADRLAGVTVPAGVEALGDAVDRASGALAAAARAEDAAVATVARREDDRAALPDPAELRRALDLHERRAALVRQRDVGDQALSDAARAVADADAALEAARSRLTSARADEQEARTRHAAHALAADLAAGDPCPVCRRPVEAPPSIEVGDLDHAAGVVARAQDEADSAADAHRRAVEERARIDTKLAGVRDELTAVELALADAPGPDVARAELARVEAADAALAAARQAVEAARRDHRRAQQRLAEARTAADGAVRVLRERRDELADLGPPPVDGDDPGEGWRALTTWAAQHAPALVEDAERAEQEAAEHDRRRADAESALRAALADADVPVTSGRSLRDACADALASARARAERLEEDRRTATELETRRDEAAAEERVATELARLLDARHFEKWVLDEVMRALVSAASTTLMELSRGAYAMDVDGRGTFTVVDHANAGAERPARTLSGGETFLASLALALALADLVTARLPGRAARLEAIFLDEGFGTLDPEALEVVADALEELGAKGRMVGVVSHVRELAERLPVRYEIRRAGATSTVERVG